MIVGILFVIAVACMVLGHIFKVRRWALLISVYEKESTSNLLTAMSLAQTTNAVLPVRIGDFIRVIWAGRKMKNGYALSASTVIVDLYVDLITVSAMFFGLALIGKGGESLQQMAHWYMFLFVLLMLMTLLCVLFRRVIKKIVQIIASIFNETIEFNMLYITYLCIASIKDIVKKIDKRTYIVSTIGMWGSYVISYVIFAEAIQRYGFFYATSDVFTKLFSGASLYQIEKAAIPLWAAYLLLPLAICLVISLLLRKKESTEVIYRQTLPQMNQSDRLAFLKTYYADENSANINSYLDINRDVVVVEDNSAGSNASTVLVMKEDGSLFYRKYAFDDDGEKLQEQIQWIENHQRDIPLPIITEQRNERNFVTYDMHSYKGVAGLFKYIHTMPVEASWNILEQSLDDIKKGLHSKKRRNTESEIITRYIEEKVQKNIDYMLENSKYIRALEQNESIIVNGRALYTLNYYRDLLTTEHLLSVFAEDEYADIHGDLTVENIVCISDDEEIDASEYVDKVLPKEYYFIDPNMGNIHESPFLDYAKLLQSLHGNYEFLMMVTSVNIGKDSVNYMMTKSEAYGKIYRRYEQYLKEHFSEKEVLSIYYHEIIHWLRLMPYKIRKNEKLAVVFYTGLLGVLADVMEMENAKEK